MHEDNNCEMKAVCTKTSTMSIFVWGSCGQGQLGLHKVEDEIVSLPTEMKPPIDDCSNICKIACGLKHTLTLAHGLVYSCGSNEFNQLGHNKGNTKHNQIMALEMQKVQDIACGSNHSIAVNDRGQIFTWGSNYRGQLGREGQDTSVKMVRAMNDHFVVQVSCGRSHTLALTRNSLVFSWGENSNGELGLGKVSSQTEMPHLLEGLSTMPVRQVCCGGNHSMALTPSGSVYSWGSNLFGQLGIGEIDPPHKVFPVLVKSLKGQGVVHVTCGDTHTAVLTKDGGVFTFGAGGCGQLGHNDHSNTFIPRKVFELMGNTVSQLCCGRMHTVAFVPSTGRLYTFGLGGKGQLGVGTPLSDRLGPATVKGPWLPFEGKGVFIPQLSMDTIAPHVIKRVYTGGDHCFLLASKMGYAVPPDDFRDWSSGEGRIAVINSQLVRELEALGAEDPMPSSVQAILDAVFSSHGCMAASMLNEGFHGEGNHFNVARLNHGVDLDGAATAQTAILSRLTPLGAHRLRSYISDNILFRKRANYPDAECLRVFLFLAVSPLMEQVQHFTVILVPYCVAVNQLDKAPSNYLDSWFSIIQPRHFKKLVVNIKSLVVHILTDSNTQRNECEMKRKREFLTASLDFLKRLHRVNERNGHMIPYTTFYIPELKERVNIEAEFFTWIQQKSGNFLNVFSFCNYPFVLNGQAKAVLLRVEANMMMRAAVMQAQQNLAASIFGLAPVDSINPVFAMEVGRNTLIHDTLGHLAGAGPGDLKKPLKVKFRNEEAVDEGGVTKEFFLLTIREVLNPDYGMFRINEESRMTWFNEFPLETTDMFHLIGKLCGLAIYNNILVDLSFPLALFKKLLDEEVTLDDLKELDPVVGRSLQSVLDYEGNDIEEVFVGLCFEMSVKCFDETRSIPLLPNGESTQVTQDNKQQYVQLYVEQVLDKSCKEQFSAFRSGFLFVCGGSCINFFRPVELQALVVGSDLYDWQELRKNCEYLGEYWDKHPVIVWFWEVFFEMTEVQKKTFLLFLTGCDRVPIVGMQGIKLKIQPNQADRDHLPAAHTCFNLLDLPKYPSKEILQNKLLLAIEQTEGFALV